MQCSQTQRSILPSPVGGWALDERSVPPATEEQIGRKYQKPLRHADSCGDRFQTAIDEAKNFFFPQLAVPRQD